MKTIILLLCIAISAKAQTVQYVTLTGNTNNNTLLVQTNQVVSLVGFDWNANVSYGMNPYGTYYDGTVISFIPFVSGSGSYKQSQIPQIFTGLTNVFLTSSLNHGAATFQITTPATATIISNYVPADAIVIPTSATGNVQIILESSADLVNWTASNPGTYGASSATNRFFRVRAAMTP